jgi:hypothetical protein
VHRHATFLLWRFFNITQFTVQSKVLATFDKKTLRLVCIKKTSKEKEAPPKRQKYSSKNKDAPKPTLPNPPVKGEVALFLV